ncbi:MAG: anaerobic ribonucleoside-triphosphate reductase activating protein [Clostridia bacterium]|nr:anaerobic ribonucleoside-triphosphate reductase activating protein [Clostridia bacterium]
MCKLRIAGTVNDSITDGPGLRFTVFTQGCPHRCAGCHNPQTHAFEGGEEVTAQALCDRIAANPLLTGVTLSGGEPFCQAEALLPVARFARARGLELAVYTGYTWAELTALGEDARTLLALCHVVVDGRFELAQRSLNLRFRGSENQRILDVAQSLAHGAPQLVHDGRWQR